MNDLISRQAAIDAVNNLTYPSSLVDVKRILVDLPSAQPEQRWIPCSERLPEEEGRYLVTCSKIEWVVDWNIWRNKPKPSWLWEQGVTAWMPLPEPYREDGKAE